MMMMIIIIITNVTIKICIVGACCEMAAPFVQTYLKLRLQLI